ncbi:MAG: hypothetical protein ACRCSU_04045 [Paracoccaceae bacterium]
MANDQVLMWRDKIYAIWRQVESKPSHIVALVFPTTDRFHAFCASKDWIQDTGEAILVHRRKGFTSNVYAAYVEFLGVMQGLYVQQDAIAELYFALTGTPRKSFSAGPAWDKMREFRNLSSGHPTNKTIGAVKGRISVPRQKMSYERVEMMFYPKSGRHKHMEINLGKMIDDYDEEAGSEMRKLYEFLEKKLGEIQA